MSVRILPSCGGNQRLAYSDRHDIVSLHILKAVLAVMILYAHVGSRDSFLALCRLTLPLFFMISGYFLLNGNGTLSPQKIRHTFVKILRLTITANLFYYAADVILPLFSSPSTTLVTHLSSKDLLRLLLVGDNISFHLWYLASLIEALAFFCVCVRCRAAKLIPLIVAVASVVNLLQNEFALIHIPAYCYSNVFSFAIPFMYAGMLVRLNEHRIRLSKRILCCVAFILLILLYAECLYFHTYQMEMMVSSTLLAITLFLLALRINTKTNILAYIGKHHSGNIYIYHIFIKDTLRFLKFNHPIHLIETIEILFVCILLSILIKRLRKVMTWIFRWGKRRILRKI